MARPKNPALAVRNEQLYGLWKSGWSLARLAEKYQRTPQQVGRIIAAFHPDLDDDDDRALHRGRLESLYEEVQEVVDAPGWKMSPNGGAAHGPDGEPAIDVAAKIEALKLKLLVLESARRLDARDKPQVKKFQFERSEAEQKMWAEIEAERRKIAQGGQATVIPGELVKELEPGAGRSP